MLISLMLLIDLMHNSHYHMPGLRKEIVTYKETENFWFTHIPVITRQQ